MRSSFASRANDPDEEDRDSFDLLMVRLEGRPFAIPVGFVLEVLPAVELSPIIDQPPEIAGLANIRSEIVAVHYLRSYAGSPPRAMEPTDQIVVVSQGESKLGLLVDSVETVQEFKEEQLFAQSLSPMAFKIVVVEGLMVRLVDLRDYLVTL